VTAGGGNGGAGAVQIQTVEFVGAITRPGQRAPEALPQIAFAGRSNVGKSSLINRLLGRTRRPIARVSSTPGKTQEINFYRIGARSSAGSAHRFLLVDLPGYGYARAPTAVRAGWGPLIESYLAGEDGLRGVVQLVDIRHPPTELDRHMMEYLEALRVPAVLVLTKADKLGIRTAAQRAVDLVGALGLPEDQVIAFSAKTGAGRDALLGALHALLFEEAPE